MTSRSFLGRLASAPTIAGVVTTALAVIVLWTAAEAFTPAATVRVAPVVFDASTVPPDASEEPGLSHISAGQSIQAPGWLEAAPYVTAATALTDGVIAEILVLEGHTVEKGQPIASLVPDDAVLDHAEAAAALAGFEAELAVAQAELAAAQTDWDNPVERERAVAATRAELARAARAQEGGAANELEVIVLTQRVAGQAATLRATERRRGILEAQRDRHHAEVIAAERNADLRVQERRSFDLARARAMKAQAAVNMARTHLEEAQLRIDRLTITAPITGAVQRRLKSPGDKVMLGMDDPHSAHVLHLYEPDKLQVRVDVPLADASQMFVGQRCEVIVEVLPDTTFEGEVTRITYEADLQKNTLQAKVRVIDPSPLLRPEMLTRVKFLPQSGELKAAPGSDGIAVLVPRSAVDNGRVWVVRDRRGETGKAYPQAIDVIEDTGDWARVRGDLRPGDLLALDTANLSKGARVRITADVFAAQGGAS